MTPASSSLVRCGWVDLTKPDYVEYHDKEWGVPVLDDQRLFEFLTLEAAQAGLSWYTVLKKRDHYRQAFAQFDPQKVAQFTPRDIEQMMDNPGLIRNRKKLEAAVNNGARFLEVQAAFGSFAKYLWQFVEGQPMINCWRTMRDCPPTSKESDAMSKDLKRRGFQFVGSTICYAHMQATGMVMDHTLDCFRYPKLSAPKKLKW